MVTMEAMQRMGRWQNRGIAAMFNVWAYATSPISGSEIAYELIQHGRGFVFQNNETGKLEFGTYTEDLNKYECLEKFYKIFRELSPRFELI